jgi:LCP family protein required for cell wall assembly
MPATIEPAPSDRPPSRSYTEVPMHARRVRPSTGPTDRRRLVAAASSAVIPGVGQLINGRARLARWLLIPSAIVLAVVGLVVATQSTTRLLVAVIVPATMSALLLLNAVILVWRLFAMGQAFFDARYRGVGVSRWAMVGLIGLTVFVSVPHVVAWRYGQIAEQTFATIFGIDRTGDGTGHEDRPAPAIAGRMNVLLIGTDARAKGRKHALTDTLIVVSVDPVGRTVSMASIPRDMVDVPLGNGDVFGPKINSLRRYVDTHEDEFDKGGIQTLQDATGALLGIPIHYYAEVDLAGFVDIVDAVGGVDINVKKQISDPNYPRPGGGHGVTIEKGQQHFDGLEALAYARIRKSAGESDFTRADRQQQVLVAIRRSVGTEDLLLQLPSLLEAIGGTVRTDIPVERLPELAALGEEIPQKAVTRVVIRHPLVHPGPAGHRYGAVQIPDVKAIRAMAAKLFPAAGETPRGWPTPKPSASPRPSPKPASP